ncbi:MAG: hypothetical protein QW038_01910 [Nanopusillaceae archaeon]
MEIGEFIKLFISILILVLLLFFLVFYILPNINEAIQNLRDKIIGWE